jgi:hypothetical protein
MKGLRKIELIVSRQRLTPDASSVKFDSLITHQPAVKILLNNRNWIWCKFTASVHFGFLLPIQIYREVWNIHDSTIFLKTCNINMNYVRGPWQCGYSHNPQLISPFSRLFMNPTVRKASHWLAWQTAAVATAADSTIDPPLVRWQSEVDTKRINELHV